jgi:hypothetical protein
MSISETVHEPVSAWAQYDRAPPRSADNPSSTQPSISSSPPIGASIAMWMPANANA